jgi:parallel beta-helix repeat protein
MGWADITNNVIDNNGDDGIDMRRSFYAPESAHSDNIAFYSGIGNDVDRNLTYTFDLSDLNPGARATLTFWLWYNMGGDADDGFNVLYWNDTWARWMPLIPVGSYDTGNTPGYQYGAVSGLDGQPGFASQNTLTYWTDDGWTQVEYDLTMFSGNPSVELRFRYGTDTTMYSTGCFIDLMEIPELEPYSASVPWQWDFESSDPLWTPNGWTRRDFVNNQFPETYIFNNNITNNNGEGIDAEYSDFDCISNRILDGNDEGLYLHNFIDAVVDDCIIDDNSQEGIDMENWVYLIITDSEITNSDNNDGIQADDYCRLDIDSSVMNWNNGDGVDVDEFCDLIITNSEMSYNDEDGVFINTFGVTYYIYGNTIIYNGDEGLEIMDNYGVVEGPFGGSNFYWVQGWNGASHNYLIYHYDLTTVASATLTFQHAFVTDPWDDGGFVEYWDGATMSWMTLFPVDGYGNTEIDGDGAGPNAGHYWGYDGYSGGWRQVEFNLDMLTGGTETTRIRFHYVTDGGTTWSGWAIDDIEVTGPGGQLYFDDAEGNTPMMNKGFIKSQGVWNYIENNVISYNDNTGIEFDNSLATVTGNVITFNGQDGIEIDDFCYLWILNNDISFNGIDGSYSGIDIVDQSYVEIRGNNISHNNYGAIDINDECQVIIDNNLMSYNHDYHTIEANDDIRIVVTNNNIINNDPEDDNYALYFYDIHNSPIIENNVILENGNGIYLDDTEVGQPPSGTYAWHTDNYYHRSQMTLERSFDLQTIPAGDTATLTFWQWYDTEGDSGGAVQVYDVPTDSWMTLMPIDFHAYDDVVIPRLFDSPGYNLESITNENSVFFETITGTMPDDGCNDGWIFAEFDLSPYAGQQNVRIRWIYSEDSSPFAGWFIDDVAIPELPDVFFDMESGSTTGWTSEGWDIVKAAGSIHDNEVSRNLEYGINFNTDVYVDITDNIIMDNGYNGIYFENIWSNLNTEIRPAAPSGSSMWYSGYSNYADFQLQRTFNLGSYSEVELTFYHWYYTESSVDGGFIEVYSNGEWIKVEPRGTYPDDFNIGSEAYSGDYEDWFYAHFDLSDYAGQTIQLRFRFITNPSTLSEGWYIDDITMYGNGNQVFYDNAENGNVFNWQIGGNNVVDNRYGPPKGWSIVDSNAITIADNVISYNGHESYAGIRLNDDCNVILEDNVINHNGYEGNWGPGVYIDDDTLISARNNEIRYNSWGGVYGDDDGYGVWQNNIITHNYGTETDATSGHGIYYDDESAIFANNYIADNQHAGMYLIDNDYVIMGNTITNNHWQGIYMYDAGYDDWNYPVYLEDNIITDNYMFDRLDGFMDDEWSGCGVFIDYDSHVHVFDGVYSNNDRYGIFTDNDVDEFQWIIDDEAEVENNAMRFYSDNYYIEEEFGGGEVYPVLVADSGYLTLKNVRDFQIWLINDDEWYGIEVEAGGTLDARDTTFDSWYEDSVSPGNYYVPNYVWTFFLPFPAIDDTEFYDYGQFMDNDLVFSGGNSAMVFATEIPMNQGWTAAGEYKVDYVTGEITISPFTVVGSGPSQMTYQYTNKRPLPYIFRVFGSLHMDDSKVVNTTSLYIETTDSVEVYNSIFTQNFHGGISSVNSNPIIQDSYFHDMDFGIFAEGGTLTIGGSGNRFENCVDGIHLSEGATATITGNMFDDNIRAITIYDSTVTITDNMITDSFDDGLHIVGSTATISGNSISNCADKAVYLRSTTATMSQNMLDGNYFSVYASATTLSMTSDSISGTTLEDIYSEDGSVVTALDITFDREEELAVVDTSLIEIQWYTVVRVLDMHMDPFDGADVDVSTSIPGSQMTGADGLTPQFVTREYVQHATWQDDFKMHQITADGNVSGIIYNGVLDVDITQSGTYTITLNLGPTIELQPGTVTFDEDSTLYSAFDMDSMFTDDGTDDELTYWWSGNNKVVITPNPDNVVDLTAATNWYGTETVEFFAMDIYGETISQNVTITVNPVNDPPAATDVAVTPVSPDNMDNLSSSYIWFDPVEAEDLEQDSIITWYKSTDGGMSYGKVEEFDGAVDVPYTATEWGEMWYFTVAPGDDQGGLGDEYASNIVTIVRIIPDVYFDDVTITPGEPTETDTLAANLENPSGDTSDTLYQWFRNGMAIDGATFDTLSSDYYDEGDTVTVIAIPFDGYNDGDPVESSEGVVIGNSPPTLESVVIAPQQPNVYDDIVAVPLGYSDPDVGDYTSYLNNTNYYHLYFVFEWRINNVTVDGVTGNALDHSYLNVGDEVMVTVTPADGEAFGASVSSDEITISAIPADEDYDQDGVPNDADMDDDNDGVPDINDAFPFDADESSDFDADGVGDEEDSDDDNDGFADPWDFAPRDPDVQWQPWIWFVILILVILLILFAYFKWYRVPKEPKPQEPATYYPEEESEEPEEEMVEEAVEEPMVEETSLEPVEEPIPEEEPVVEEPPAEEKSSEFDKEMEEISAMAGDESETTTEAAGEETPAEEAAAEPKKKPKKKKKRMFGKSKEEVE